MINIAKALEWFHCRLTRSLVEICAFYDIIAFSKFPFNITNTLMVRYTNIAFIVLSYWNVIENIIFWMNYCFMVHSRA